MKCRIKLPTLGWLPQDPYIPGHLKIVSNRQRRMSKAKIVTGSSLLLIGLIAFSASIMAMQQTNEIWDKSYGLNSNEQSAPSYISCTYGTTNSSDNQPTHDGKIMVNGGPVEFTVISREQIITTFDVLGKKGVNVVGLNDPECHEILSTTIEGTYTFSIPANGDYEFIIQNLGNQPTSVNFNLITTWTYLIVPIIGLSILLVTSLLGTLLIVSGRRSRKATSSKAGNLNFAKLTPTTGIGEQQ